MSPALRLVSKAAILAWLGALIVLAPLSAQGTAPDDEKARALALSPDKENPAKKIQSDWNQLTGSLLGEYFARYPDQGFQRGWPAAQELRLGTFGAHAEIRWRDALRDARTSLGRIETGDMPQIAVAQFAALDDWLEGQSLLIGSQSLATSDPSGYVQRATRLLQAAAEAVWIPKDQRLAKLVLLLGELPSYFDDARTSLIAPSGGWIDLALRDLDDLDELVKQILPTLPARPKASPASVRKKPAGVPKRAGAELDPLATIDSFRHWLLDVRVRAGRMSPLLNGDEWTRLVQLVSGSALEQGELKALCLRDLARIEPLARRAAPPALLRSAEPETIAQHAWNASARALTIGQEARLLRFPVYPKSIEFAVEESPRTRSEPVWLRIGTLGVIRAFIELPSRTWSAPMTDTRYESLQPRRQIALGIRHGMAGEGLFAYAARTNHRPLAAFLCNRAVYEGIGLYTLDWLPDVDWVENPFRQDDRLLREFELVRGYEAARFLAALEQHAEGLSLAEAAAAFQRRTAVDEDTARAEALQAQRDPLHGIGYLGLIELQGLARNLTALTNDRKGLALTLMATGFHPELRPSDLVPVVAATLERRHAH